MKSSSFGYLVQEGGRNVMSNRLMSLASVGVLTACLLLVGATALLTMNVNSIIGYVEDQNEAMVFVEDSVDEDGINQIADELRAIPNIKDVDFVSKEEALEQQQQLVEDNAHLFEGFVDDNPYPNSFRLKVDDLSQLTETLAQVEDIEGTDGITASADLAATITDIKKGISFAGFYIVGIMSLVSLVIVINTIKITVFSRRKAINIMKYVGATDLFIRLPFLVEGIILGLTSALVAFFMLWGGYVGVIHWMSDTTSSWMMLAFANLIPFSKVAWQLLGAFLGAGMGIGGIGSMLFTGKFLKV